MAPLWIPVVRPVGRSDLAFQENQLSGFDGRTVTECPGMIMLVAKRRWHREATDVWQWHDECKHVRVRKFTNIACGKVIVRKEIGTGEQLDSLFTYIAGNSGVNPMELFHCIIKFILWNGRVWFRAFASLEFIGSSHPVWMIQGKIDVAGPFLFRTVLKIDGNMSWRDGTGGGTRLD